MDAGIVSRRLLRSEIVELGKPHRRTLKGIEKSQEEGGQDED